MTSLTLLLIAGGLLVVILIMLAAVLVARSLDGASSEKSIADVQKLLAERKPPGGNSKWSTGALSATLAALATQAGADGKKAPGEDNKAIKQIITGMAVVAGLIALVMGIIAGDG